MQTAIIGLPKSGKTTVFNALTGARAKTGAYSVTTEANVAVVQVPDPRLGELAKIFKPKKVVHAVVEYVDAGGVVKGGAKSEGISGQLLNQISKADALLEVVRVFEDESLPHPEGSVNPARDVATMDLELAFSDLSIIERRLERLKESVHKVKPQEREAGEREFELLTRIKGELEKEIPLRAQQLSEDEKLAIRAFQFLSEKPLLIVLNLGENQMERAAEIQAEVSRGYDVPNTAFTTLCGQVEAEVAELPQRRRSSFWRLWGSRSLGSTV